MAKHVMTPPLFDKDLADHLPTGIIVITATGAILWWNSAATLLFALTDQTHINQLPSLNVLFSQPRTDAIEITIHAPVKLRIALSLRPYQSTQWLIFAKDVTHLHHLEQMRQDFVANVSHELRTPLTVIHGYLEALLDQADCQYEKIHRQLLQQTLRMENLVADLLLLARLENDTPESIKFTLIDVPPLLTKIIADARSINLDRPHPIHADISPTLKIYGIENELISAFSNLIFNAIHYTPPGESITIRWHQDKPFIYLDIIDSGIGIAPEHIERITERFYRVDRGRSRASGGTGLGLAIVKHALLRHHAHLHIESQLGKGSLFRCVFPITDD